MLFRTCESAFLASFKTYVCNEGRDSGRSAAGFSPGLSPACLGLLKAERENDRAGFVHSAGSFHVGRSVVVRFVHSVAGLWRVAGLLSGLLPGLLSDFGRRQRMQG